MNFFKEKKRGSFQTFTVSTLSERQNRQRLLSEKLFIDTQFGAKNFDPYGNLGGARSYLEG